MDSNRDNAAGFWKHVVALRPNWKEAREKLGNSLLSLDRFEEGISEWRQAISLLPTDSINAARSKQAEDWWSSKPCWNGQPVDRYPDLYNKSVELIHRGKFDAHLQIMRMGMEVQEEFAHKHELDKLGICFLRAWTYAIGHMALLDVYAKMSILGLARPRKPIILDAKPANRHYLNYWRKYFPSIITDKKGVELLTPLAERLEEHLHLVTYADGSRLYHGAAVSDIEERWQKEGRAPLLKLTAEDEERGWQQLKRLGVPSSAWFVGLHVRDTAAFNSRNTPVESYRQAIESIAERGGWVIRMGDPSMPPMPKMPNTIDYVHSDAHSDWMDVFLWAGSRFYIGTNSGPAFVVSTFGVPCVVTNNCPIMASAALANHKNIGIYKLYWSEKENRYMSFSEAFTSEIGMSESSEQLKAAGIKLIDNSSEEIKDLVVEMLERLDGKAHYSSEDEDLQTKFKRLKPNEKEPIAYPHGRIGRAFLRKYAQLL